MHYFKI